MFVLDHGAHHAPSLSSMSFPRRPYRTALERREIYGRKLAHTWARFAAQSVSRDGSPYLSTPESRSTFRSEPGRSSNCVSPAHRLFRPTSVEFSTEGRATDLPNYTLLHFAIATGVVLCSVVHMVTVLKVTVHNKTKLHGAGTAAKILGVSRQHLYLVAMGKRKSPRIERWLDRNMRSIAS